MIVMSHNTLCPPTTHTHTHTHTHTQPPNVDEYYLGKVDKDGSTELGSDIEFYKRGERFSKEVPCTACKYAIYMTCTSYIQHEVLQVKFIAWLEV